MEEYVERLWPSVSWWCLAVLFGVGAGLVVVPVLPLALVLLVIVVVAALCCWALVAYAAQIQVSGEGLRAGPALLPWDAIGPVSVLGVEESRAVRGPRADPRAYLLLRAYVPTAVTVGVLDRADPTPYWYLSSRRPEALAAALQHGPHAGPPDANRHG